MKKSLYILVVTAALMGENLAISNISAPVVSGSIKAEKKQEEKVEAPYTLDIEKDQLHCSFQDKASSAEIHFLSTRGQLISKHPVEEGVASIDLSGFANSLYLVKGYQEGNVLFAKAIQVQ